MDVYTASVRDRLRSALHEAQAQLTTEACWQKWYYNRKIGIVNLKPGNLVLVKADAWKGKRKIKDRWKKRLGRWCGKSWLMSPPMKWQNQHRMVMSPPLKLASSHCVRGWHSLVYGQPSYTGQVYQSHPMQDYLCLEVMKWGCHKRKMAGWSPNDLPVKLPWGGKMGELQLRPWMSTGGSTEDGWRTTGKVIWLQTSEGTCM